MYDSLETEISRKHLVEVLKAVDEPIVLMGGWAVFYHVNPGFERTTGRIYIGSRDIDLGFHIEMMDDGSAFDVSLRTLVEDLGFSPVSSSRLMKEIDRESGDILSSGIAKNMPMYDIFQMYVDLIVDSIPDRFTEKYSFTPIDEPLLSRVFSDPLNRTELELGGRPVWLPSPDVLISMKMRSYPDRDKEHKRLKDLSDIAALVLFSEAVPSVLSSEDLKLFRETLDRDLFIQIESFTGLSADLIANAIQSVSR